ncbi:hypothetical protein SAMN04488005_2437 [Yoonia tamlensis]|uniref:Phytase-like domain-containing protein n=1 Tax=Yoonia tamlensis TaxID=390270 RepID=A0A1I6HAS9_9RHOB|nr:esterase-like activity of phytase family protein [Yoonia tamlensis]SFR51451.1 hypothetical protein SAMN04488005_2437 [Yoonia tamlensis]
MRMILALVVWALAVPARAETTFIGSYIWASDDARIGGLSGIAVAQDGQAFTAVSDRSFFVTGQFARTDGIISAITDIQVIPITGTGAQGDSEGIAIASTGDVFISFEGVHGLRHFATLDTQSTALPAAPAFATMQRNSSLEALAIDANGVLYTLPERSGRATRPFPVYRYANGVWDQPFTIPRRGAFLVAGADIGPDALLYVLERDFTGFGFRSRVRRFDLQGQREETLLETGTFTHDNLEGISVWNDGVGLRITLVSDDNFRRFQRTEIVEYRISD